MIRPISLLMALLFLASMVGSLVVPSVMGPDAEAKKRRRNVHSQVVGGSPAPGDRFPFVAAIGEADPSGAFLKDNQFCGGSLVAPSYVLTAAHCTIGWGPERFVVVVGRTELSSNQGEVRSVAEITVHPEYDRQNALNDIALLRLDKPVTTITPVQVVSVNDGTFDAVGTSLTLVGWGDIKQPSHKGKGKGKKKRKGSSQIEPDRMNEVQVSVVDDATCAQQWRRTGYKNDSVWPSMLCTTAKTFGPGDSGGPLFVSSNGAYVQVGLVSGSFDGKSDGKKMKNIPDYGPQLSAPSSADFIASIAGQDITGATAATARRTDNPSSQVTTEPHKAKKGKQGKKDKKHAKKKQHTKSHGGRGR